MAPPPPAYQRGQVDRYFDRIALADSQRIHDVRSLSDADKAAYLALLQKHHLSSVPFENLSLHYSLHHQIHLHPDALYRKIVESNGRGGYCMENNFVLACLLRSVGFDIYTSGARVYQGPELGYTGWSHMIIFVLIGADKYWVDVGFGSNGPVVPVRLPDKAEVAVTQNLAPSSLRLEYKKPDGFTDPGSKLWCFALRYDDDKPWQDMYAFTELEFLKADYDVMNHHTSTSSSIFFTHKIVCSKMLLDSEGQFEGVVILQHDLKVRKHGETVTSKEFKSEEDRLQALREHFGIEFAPHEIDGIRGTAAEIKPDPASS